MTQIKTEQAIIGCILLQPALFPEWAGVLTVDDFAGAKTQQCWKIMTELNNRRRAIDIIAVNSELSDMKYITMCIDLIGFLHNFPDYVRILKEQSLRRDILNICQTEKDPNIVADKILFLPRYEVKSKSSFPEIADRTHQLAISTKGTAFSFNLEKLQSITGGLDRAELLLIGGFTSHGKSSLAAHLSIGFAHRHKILYCTSEMSEEEVMRRLFANQCRVNIGKFRAGYITESENKKITEIKLKMKEWKYEIVRVSTVEDVQREITKNNPDICIVDHLNNLSSLNKKASRFEIVTENITRLQSICLSEKIGMIVLSQLHRPQDKTKIKVPELQSFRSSGEIEEKANIVVMCWWEAKAKQIVYRQNVKEPENYEIRILKNRDGECGFTKLNFYPEFSLFENYVEETI